MSSNSLKKGDRRLRRGWQSVFAKEIPQSYAQHGCEFDRLEQRERGRELDSTFLFIRTVMESFANYLK